MAGLGLMIGLDPSVFDGKINFSFFFKNFVQPKNLAKFPGSSVTLFPHYVCPLVKITRKPSLLSIPCSTSCLVARLFFKITGFRCTKILDLAISHCQCLMDDF